MKKIIYKVTQIIISIWSLRTAKKILKGKKTMYDVPERFRKCVKEAIRISEL